LTNESAGADFTPINMTLRDGRRVTLRSIRPDDGDGVQVAMGRLSGEARYMRFMAAVKELSPDMLKRAVNPVAGRDLALLTRRFFSYY
jgi:acetyltransferase